MISTGGLYQVLARYALGQARDGDCLRVAPLVTRQLRAQGVDASTATVFGWVDEAATVIAFAHVVTVAAGYVLDATAQQFGAHLPECWVASISEYVDRLTEATGVLKVTVHIDQ